MCDSPSLFKLAFLSRTFVIISDLTHAETLSGRKMLRLGGDKFTSFAKKYDLVNKLKNHLFQHTMLNQNHVKIFGKKLFHLNIQARSTLLEIGSGPAHH